jgi:hypothetical protein
MKKTFIVLILICLLSLTEIKGFKWMPKQQREELLYFPSNEFVKAVTGGFDLLLADFLWIETGSYYGKHRLSDKSYPYLYHMFNIVTDLDPQFLSPYTFGAMLLADDAKRLDLALKLLDKGIIKNPELWQIPFTKGFILYIFEKNNLEASRWFLFAYYIEGAPELALKFATWTLIKGKGVELTLHLYLKLYETSSSPIFKEKAIEGISKTLSSQYKEFYKDKKYYANSLFALYRAGYLPFIPEIPGGTFDIKDGQVVFRQFQ